MHVSACMIDASADISFDRMDLPTGVRRRSSSAVSERAVRDFADLGESIPDFPGADRATPDRESSKSLDRFLVAIEGAGSGHLPVTLEDLAGAGLPSALLDELRALVAAGYAEADVVRALCEALEGLVADGTISAPVSRQFLRALRRQFGNPDECRELRGKVKMATVAALAASVA